MGHAIKYLCCHGLAALRKQEEKTTQMMFPTTRNLSRPALSALLAVSLFTTTAIGVAAQGQPAPPPLPPDFSRPAVPPPARAMEPVEGLAPNPQRLVTVNGYQYAGDQIMVKFKPGLASATAEGILAGHGSRTLSHAKGIGW